MTRNLMGRGKWNRVMLGLAVLAALTAAGNASSSALDYANETNLPASCTATIGSCSAKS